MANGIIGLDNITNIATGLDKELLDMTYPDKYYQNVIQPAKLGKGPIPSKIEMLSKFQPGKAMRIGIDPYLPSFMGGGKYAAERAKPTAAASKFLNTLGKGAKFLGTKVGGLGILDILTPTELGADDIVTQEMRDSIDTTGINSLRGDPAQFYEVDPYAGIMEMQNKGTLDYPEVNYKMTTEFPNTRGGLIPNPEYIDYEKGELYNINDTSKIPRFTDRIKGGIETMKDKLGSVGDFITGGGIIGSALKGLGNMFEYRGGIGYVDQDGVFRSADELDKLNALGGYYTDIARASRRRDRSIQRMLRRKAEGKRIGEQRLKDLLEQQAKEEAARQEAARQMQDANRAARTGGYQSSFASDTDFMEGDPNAGGQATTATMGST